MSETNLNGGIDVENTLIPKPTQLIELCENNAKIFQNDTTENGQRLYLSLLSIKDNILNNLPVYNRLENVVQRYDFDENTPGNGYRSFLNIYNVVIDNTIQLNKRISSKCGSVLFRKAFYTK